MKKSSAQSGLSPIIVIVLIVIAILVLVVVIPVAKVFFGISGASTKQNSTPIQSTSTTEKKIGYEDFDKMETDSYIFYYPKGYIKKDPPSDVSYAKLYFANPNTKAVRAEDIITFTSTSPDPNVKLDAPSYDYCVKQAESYRRKGDDDIKAEVVSGGIANGKGVGCKFTVKTPVGNGINDAGVMVQKILWNVGANIAYGARAFYYANASSSEAEKLNLAIDQFTLK